MHSNTKEVQPEGIMRSSWRFSTQNEISGSYFFGLGQTKSTKRVCWTDVNNKPKKKKKKKKQKKKKGMQQEDFSRGHPS